MPFLWFGLGVLFVVSISNSISDQGDQQWKDILVHFEDKNDLQFLMANDIEDMVLSCYNIYETRVEVRDVDLLELEMELEEHPYVEDAEAFINRLGEMQLRVTQSNPLVRVKTVDGRDYYLSENGIKMPVSTFYTARVPVCSGQVNDNGSMEGRVQSSTMIELHQIMLHISKDRFWSALFEQIYVNDEKEFVLIPKIGEQEIVVGDGSELEEKFSRLRIFYKEMANQLGWDKYKRIDIKFKDQIVCTKK